MPNVQDFFFFVNCILIMLEARKEKQEKQEIKGRKEMTEKEDI